MHEFIPATDADRRTMLDAIGVSAISDLFANIPAEIQSRHENAGIKALTEMEARQELLEISAKNVNPIENISFMGGGSYEHDMPSAVNHLLLRQEFLTCYTPYQAELSQGTLTWMFEFQTMVCELTGMEVANSSMYDGASSLAEGVLMAERVTKRMRFAVAGSLNPAHRAVINTFQWARGYEFIDIPYDAETGQLDRDALAQAASEPLAALIIQTPNVFGIIEDLSDLKEIVGDGFLVVSTNPISLGVLAPPGQFDADIVVCEGQTLGHPTQFGGPQLGMFATKKQFIRQMPGRLAGRTVDREGKTGYVMTLQAREQHIRRAKATSNICTNQALIALGATIYLSLLGKHGLRQLGELNVQKAHYLKKSLADAGLAPAFSGPTFNEFGIRSEDVAGLYRNLKSKGFLTLNPDWLSPCGVEDVLLLAVTEKRTRAQMDNLINAIKEG
jgi:glycine dehydrogenase subunit 1